MPYLRAGQELPAGELEDRGGNQQWIPKTDDDDDDDDDNDNPNSSRTVHPRHYYTITGDWEILLSVNIRAYAIGHDTVRVRKRGIHTCTSYLTGDKSP